MCLFAIIVWSCQSFLETATFQSRLVQMRIYLSFPLFSPPCLLLLLLGPYIVHASFFVRPVIVIEQNVRRNLASLFRVVEKLARQDGVFEIGHAIRFPGSLVLFQGFPLSMRTTSVASKQASSRG